MCSCVLKNGQWYFKGELPEYSYEIPKSIKLYAELAAKEYSNPYHKYNDQKETFRVEKMLGLSDNMIAVIMEQTPSKMKETVLFYQSVNKWFHFIPSESHILGMRYFKIHLENRDFIFSAASYSTLNKEAPLMHHQLLDTYTQLDLCYLSEETLARKTDKGIEFLFWIKEYGTWRHIKPTISDIEGFLEFNEVKLYYLSYNYCLVFNENMKKNKTSGAMKSKTNTVKN